MAWSSLLTRRGMRSILRGGLHYIFGKRGQRRVHGFRMFYRLRVEMMLRSRKPIQGLTRFPVAKIWVDREAFPRILRLLRRARHTVLIQMFIWKDDYWGRRMAKALVELADDGVRVEIHKEAVGDVFEFQKDFLSTQDKEDPLWKRFWHHPRIHIAYETNDDHTKVFVIDDRVLLLTGMNIADEYYDEWHDYLVELRGHRFVEHYLSGGDVPGTFREATLVMNTDQRKEIRPTIMRMLQSAKQSIVVEHCYFSDTAVADALIRRSKEGIRVVVILPERPDVHYYANMQTVSRLLSEGDRRFLSVFFYPRVVHGKILLVDRERAFLGSANLMASSLDDMGEMNVLLQGKSLPAIRKLRDVLRDDILISTPVSKPPPLQFLWKWLTWLKL